jgi:hypothetical protein
MIHMSGSAKARVVGGENREKVKKFLLFCL